MPVATVGCSSLTRADTRESIADFAEGGSGSSLTCEDGQTVGVDLPCGCYVGVDQCVDQWAVCGQLVYVLVLRFMEAWFSALHYCTSGRDILSFEDM